MNNVADAAWYGNFPFDTAEQNFRAIGVIYPEILQVVATQSSGITSLDDIVGARVAIGPPGSGTAVVTEQLLQVMGLDVGSDISAVSSGFGDASALMQDGHLDVSFAVLGVPASAIVELEISTPLNFLSVSDQLLADLRVVHPYFDRHIIPAGTYSNTEDIHVIYCQAVLYVRYDMDADMVYELTRVFFQNSGETAAAHAMGAQISLDNALNGITTPVHIGAVRFFESVGITVPANLIID